MSTEATTAQPKTGLRYKLGLTMFVVGQVITFGSPVFVPALGLPIGWIAGFVVGGEAITIGAIPVLGMAGFKALKNKMFSFLKMPPVDQLKPVSKARHVIGLVLVLGSLFVLQWAAALFVVEVTLQITPEQPTPTVLGIPHAQQLDVFLSLMLAGEVLTVIGLICLGGLWWERMRQLFVWPGEAAR